MRLIDADEAIINFGFEWDDICPTRDEVVSFLRKQKTIAAVPVVHGEWVYSRTQSEFAVSKCSACGKEQFSISHVVKDGKYCPNCGAKMESEGNT